MKLVVVESPAKAKTIEKYLGSGHRVLASFGHARDQPPCNLFLACFGPILDAVGSHEVNAVATSAHNVARHVVGHDPVRPFRNLLRNCPFDYPLGLGSKADEKARTPIATAKLRQNVASRHELQLRRSVALFELRSCRLDPPVGDGCDEDCRVGRQ